MSTHVSYPETWASGHMARRINEGVKGTQKPHFPTDVMEFSTGDLLLSKVHLCAYNRVPAIRDTPLPAGGQI